MAVKIAKKPGVAVVTQSVSHKKEVGAESVKEETVEVPVAVAGLSIAALEPPCEVGMEASYTHNLGNYSSARVAVSLKVPCEKTGIEDTFEWVKDWVETKLNDLTAQFSE